MRSGLIPAVAIALLVLPQVVSGATLELRHQAAIRLAEADVFAEEHGLAGSAVASAGDVDGDGRPDFAIGSPGFCSFGFEAERDPRGRVYVVFSRSLASSRLERVASEGRGQLFVGTPGDCAGWSLANAGDINGDGLADLLVGAPGASPHGRRWAGSAYVVFGQPQAGRIDLGTLVADGKGYRIDGAASTEGIGDGAGWAVASVGDQNGDGRPDAAIGSPGASPGGREFAGSTYVVFGQSSPGAIDLRTLVADGKGYRIDGEGTYVGGGSGRFVAAAGDVNADGRTDVLVGSGSGRSYVVFGQTTARTIDLRTLVAEGAGHMLYVGVESPVEVAGAGDLNEDGFGDFAVGLPFLGPAGSVYVVFGRPDASSIAVSSLIREGRGYRIDGVPGGFGGGVLGTVSSLGDINDDGRADLLVGDSRGWGSRDPGDGRAYVVFGRADADIVRLQELRQNGYEIRLESRYANGLGAAVAGIGDLDGDARPDLLLGAPGFGGGAAFVVFSPRVLEGTAASDTLMGTDASDLIFGIGGDDTIAGLGGHDLLEGGAGGDRLLGGTGVDGLWGGAGSDLIWGEAGPDRLVGGTGADRLWGQAGDDLLRGGVGSDRLFGGGGPDRLLPGEGGDWADGGAGNDRINARDRHRDRINGGSGTDRALIDREFDRVTRVEFLRPREKSAALAGRGELRVLADSRHAGFP